MAHLYRIRPCANQTVILQDISKTLELKYLAIPSPSLLLCLLLLQCRRFVRNQIQILHQVLPRHILFYLETVNKDGGQHIGALSVGPVFLRHLGRKRVEFGEK